MPHQQPQPTSANEKPLDILKSVFGYNSFRGQQEEVIEHVLAGQSACVLMPTGAGKSLCYQIPALCMNGVAIVVSPLIALMQDQVAALKELGVRAAMLNSALDFNDKQAIISDLCNNELDLIYIAPERLANDSMLEILDQTNIALIAIDEAHCMSQWGHDFRPEYRMLSALRQRYPHVPCLAVTATADEPTRKDIVAQLGIEKTFVAGFDRPNIRYEVASKNTPKRQLQDFLANRRDESGIVYCLSRKKVDTTAKWLQEAGFKALPYHAGLNANTRAKNQERFIKEEGMIMVATIAFGMGIDKPDVRFVAHLDLPSNIEAYYQETGRAGRDGLPAVGWMVYGLQDVALRRHMINDSNAPETQKRIEHHKLSAFLGYCEAATCRRKILLHYFGDESEDCGNCDSCLNPPETTDGTTAAQKILSCVYRTGQMFGTRHIVDVLQGKDTPQIQKHGHAEISTYGIGTEHDRKIWDSFIRQLVSRNYLRVDMDNHGGLKLTQDGGAFLKERSNIQLSLPRVTASKSSARSASRTEALQALESEKDIELYNELKALRLSLAQEKNIPPYIIFHDKTLIAMALSRPAEHYEMGQIPGVGASKLEKYGPDFLACIKENTAA